MQAFLNTAIQAARKAGDIAQMNFNRINESDIKTKSYNEFVTFVDEQAEAAIKEIIQSRYPDHGMIAEESENNTNNKQDFVWIIDPLDGTTNYVHSFPVYAVSIALQIKGVLEVGVIYDPSRQELFTALRGGGSQLDERRIRVSKQRTLEGALLGTGFPYRQKKDWLDIYLEIFSEFSQKTAGIRRPGAVALDLAYVASGRLDGFWEFGLNPWDIAAGVLLIQESGGLCENLIPNQDMIESGNLFAGNPKIFDQMKQIISKYGPKLTQLS
jgi:myo-inositol-1(or 4)-monophosphatase